MKQQIMKGGFLSFVAAAVSLPTGANTPAWGLSMSTAPDGAKELLEAQVAGMAEDKAYSSVSDEEAEEGDEFAKKLTGTYAVAHGGESYNNDFFELLPVQKEYLMTVEVEGDQLILRNFDDSGNACSLYGKLESDGRRIDFNTQHIHKGWDVFRLSGMGDGTFSATVSDDFTTLTFDSFRLLFRDAGFEAINSLTLTKLPDPIAEWSVAGTTKWVTEEGKYSTNLKKNTNVTLTKFVQGTEVYYELSDLGHDSASPIPVKLSVNADGALKFVNACDGSYYDNVRKQGDSVALYPYDAQGIPESGMEGDAMGGEFHAPYYYYGTRSDYSVTECGVLHVLWGTYDIPELEFTTSPANGSRVESISNITFTFSEADTVKFDENAQNVSIVDENGNNVGSNISLGWTSEQNQITVSCNEILEPGTYSITVGKGTFVLDGKAWDQDIVILLTVKEKWQGGVVLPENITTVEDLLNVSMAFPFAESIEISNYGALGAIYDTDGSVYALLFTTNLANVVGNIDIDGEHVAMRFAKMSDLTATLGNDAESIAKSIAGFVQPEVGVAMLYVCPNSFTVDGTIFAKGILKTYEVFGSGHTTDVAGMPINSTAGTYHDLQGRRIAAPQKGIVIQNGRKIVR